MDEVPSSSSRQNVGGNNESNRNVGQGPVGRSSDAANIARRNFLDRTSSINMSINGGYNTSRRTFLHDLSVGRFRSVRMSQNQGKSSRLNTHDPIVGELYAEYNRAFIDEESNTRSIRGSLLNRRPSTVDIIGNRTSQRYRDEIQDMRAINSAPHDGSHAVTDDQQSFPDRPVDIPHLIPNGLNQIPSDSIHNENIQRPKTEEAKDMIAGAEGANMCSDQWPNLDENPSDLINDKHNSNNRKDGADKQAIQVDPIESNDEQKGAISFNKKISFQVQIDEIDESNIPSNDSNIMDSLHNDVILVNDTKSLGSQRNSLGNINLMEGSKNKINPTSTLPQGSMAAAVETAPENPKIASEDPLLPLTSNSTEVVHITTGNQEIHSKVKVSVVPKTSIDDPQDQTFDKNPNQFNKTNTNTSVGASQDPTQGGEFLGENFLETQWLPPSIHKGLEYKRQNMFMEGTAPYFGTRVVSAQELSVGICSYFQFTKTVAIYMSICSLFTIPSLLFSYFGSRISEQDKDSMGLYRYTIGNIGYDPSSLSYDADSQCSFSSTRRCIHLSSNIEISYEAVAYTVLSCEVVQNVLLLVMLYHLNFKISWLKHKLNSLTCHISNYSIMVRNLPKMFKLEELVYHFSNLYRLDRKDWKDRPVVEGTSPLKHCFNTGNSLYIGTWIAECEIRKAIGSLLRAFKTRQSLVDKLLRSRAEMKMYNFTTCHGKGHDPERYNQAKTVMDQSVGKIMEITRDIVDDTNVRLLSEESMKYNQNHRDIESHMPSGPSHLHDYIDADITSAFVCFEYSESMARCLEDYSAYSKFPYNLFCYPDQLRFKGKRLRVQQASEPSEILWENLEISKTTKTCRRFRTIFLTLALSIACFVAIVQSTIYKNQLASSIPSSGLCESTIPSLYVDTNAIDKTSIALARPYPSSTMNILDSYCSGTITGSFYAIYSFIDDPSAPATSYSVEACSSQESLCPIYGSALYCPCISTSSSQSCNACESSSSSCSSTFQAKNIGGCYCKSQLFSLIQSSGPLDALSKIQQLQSSNVCDSFFLSYIAASSFRYFAIFVTFCVNQILAWTIKLLTTWECYSSVDKIQGKPS